MFKYIKKRNTFGMDMSTLSLSKSELKTRIIVSLLDGGKTVSDFETELKILDTTILHALKQLERLGLTTKNSGIHSLTSLGLLEAQIYRGHQLSLEVLSNYKEFWLNHDVKAIPHALMMHLGALSEAEVIQTTPVSLDRVHAHFLSLLLSAKNIFGVSPIFHPDFVKAFREVLQNGAKIQLIATPEVLSKFKQEGTDLISKYVSMGSLQLFVKDDIKFALTVTDRYFSLGLFDLRGQYDSNSDLVGIGEKGLLWASQMFRSALVQSTPYTDQAINDGVS
jgi:predicted transcriptional regulator